MFTQFALFDLSASSLLIILAIVLVLFGGSRLPKLAGSVGESMRELRKGLSDGNAKKEDKEEA